MSLAALADLAPGRLDVAVGVSSPLLVESWHGIAFDRPVERMVQLISGLKSAFAGERLGNGFKLDLAPEIAPRLIVATTGPRMLREAAPLADGVMVNWCTADDLSKIPGMPEDPAAISGLVYICPTMDTDECRAIARKLMSGYLSAPGYAALQRLVGRGRALERYWALSEAGDRKAAAAAIPDETIDEFVAHGSPAKCRARITEWERRGLTPLVVVVGPTDYQSRLRYIALDDPPERWPSLTSNSH
jgi:alkanesulfonate monooxygenase SsuD/methylene tetrahydromethanopterin reductase-like flavin-dependent oxidoreductase (luciferase family)